VVDDLAIGKLRRVPLREVWLHEARDFTTWLERNPDALSELLDFPLDNVERERRAGSFSVDLVAEDQSGDTVVIENQLEKSDHDHLGKLITYLSALEAKVAIWIVSEPRPEHVGAITWLNESPLARFYLVKAEAVRIGDSPAAPLLTLITGPSQEARDVGMQKQERIERHDLREAFWASLLERAKARSRLHSGVSAGTDTWLSAGSGRSGIHYTYVLRQHDTDVELRIEGPSEAENHEIFSLLFEDRTEIEENFGEQLEWNLVEGRKKCSVKKNLSAGGYRADRADWPQIQESMIDAMIRLEEAIKARVAGLPI
jgi:Domain of unknown function (DUF4268)